MTFFDVQDASNSSSAGVTSVSATFASTVTSGNCVIGVIMWGSTVNDLTSVTDDKGNTYTVKDTLLNLDGGSASSFILGNITNGPKTVSANFSASVANDVIIISEFSGVAASSDPTDVHHAQTQARPGTGTDAISSGAATTTVNGDLIFGGAFDASGANTTFTAGTSFTLGTTNSGLSRHAADEFRTQASAGSVSATFTGNQSGADYFVFMIAAKAATSATTRYVFSQFQDRPIGKFGASEQQFQTFESFGGDKFPLRYDYQSSQQEVFIRKVNVSDHQFQTLSPFIKAVDVTTPTWVQQESYPVFIYQFNVSDQQFESWPFQGSIFSITPQGWASPSPDILIVPFNVIHQQFQSFEPQGIISPFTRIVYSESPEISILQFNVSQQQFQSLEPQGLIFSITPQGWASPSPDILIVPFNTALQQFEAFASLGNVASPSTPKGWMSQTPEYEIFIRGFGPYLQQFGTDFEPIGLIGSPVSPQGWMGQQPSYELLIRSFNVSQQQFGAFGPLGSIAPPPPKTLKPSWLVMARRRGRR